jgi:3-oxoacyl-(acyl-carrier-protein) synthase
MIGHTLGAAGAIAGITCVLAIQTGWSTRPSTTTIPTRPARSAGSRPTSRETVKVALLNAFASQQRDRGVQEGVDPAARPRSR